MVGIPGVHRVSHLVDQSEHIGQAAAPVEQHVGMHSVNAGGVCTSLLAFIFKNVDPSFCKCLSDHRHILLPQRLQRFEHIFLGILVCDSHRVVADHRRIDVVHVKLVDAEHLLAQADVAVHLVQVPVDALDQIVADGRRHVDRADGCLER